MSIDVISEIWKAVKGSIDENDLDITAEALVNILIDNDYEPSEIKTFFKRDTQVMEALGYYTQSLEEEEDEDYDDLEDDDY